MYDKNKTFFQNERDIKIFSDKQKLLVELH